MTAAKTHSFKSLRKDGTLKSRDLYRAHIDSLTVVPGQSGRLASERLEESVKELEEYMRQGGQVPPLEVRVNPTSGEIEIVQGHRRRLAYLSIIPERQAAAREQGLPEDKVEDLAYVECVPFTGNDVDRVARIVSGNSHEALTPLEEGLLFARLRDEFQLNIADIMRKTGKPRRRVETCLTLAGANHDVQQQVQHGDIKATEAAKLVKQHGDLAGEKIKELSEVAKAEGKKRVTSGVVSGRPPKAVVQDLTDRVGNLVGKLPQVTLDTVAQYRAEPDQFDPEQPVKVPLALLAGLMAAHGNMVDVQTKREAAAQAPVEDDDEL